MNARWGLLGVPSSAGAHTPGLEKAPAAVREAGLAGLLPGGVHDHGDVPPFRWRPDPGHPGAQNATEVARVATDTATGVARILAAGQTPLVVGGDCSITIGVIAGFLRHGVAPGLLYVDGGPDLYTPATRPNGNLDAMVMAHLLAIDGHVPEVASVAGPPPMLAARDIVCYGHTLPSDDPEHRLLDDLGITHLHADEVHAAPAAAAARARRAMAGPFVVHCDVDVLAFADTPLADVPDSGGDPIGLTLDELAESLAVLTAGDRFAALVLTEINPDHAPGPDVLRGFLAAVAAAIAPT